MIFLALSCNGTLASKTSRVEQDLNTYDRQLAKLEADFSSTPEDIENVEWVKAKLNHMYEMDQFMRGYWNTPVLNNYSEEETAQFFEEFLKRNNLLDIQNTSDTKKLLKKYNWFTISRFGSKADNQGWIIVQHADLDVNFQKDVLSRLKRLYPLQETRPANYAYLYDRIASSFMDPSKRTLQLYGTQGECVGPGQWEPFPIEDESNVDQRRKSFGLSTMQEYKSLFKDICR